MCQVPISSPSTKDNFTTIPKKLIARSLDARDFGSSTMSFEGLQERLTALQETTTQLKELIDRLATLKFAPGSVPLATDEEGSVSGELSGEISQSLKDGEEEHELLAEEVEYVRGNAHDKSRLRDSIEKLGKELAR